MIVTVIAAAVVLLEGLVLWAVFPVMHFYVAALGGGEAWVGLMFALMTLPKVATNPLLGRASESWGRRPVLILAGVGSLSASVIWALAPNLGWLAVSRVVTGLFGVQAALTHTLIADTTTPDRRAAGMGLIGAAFALSMVFGPLLGGSVAEAFGHAAVGWMAAGLQTLSLLLIVTLLPETRPRVARPVPDAEQVRLAPAPPKLLTAPRVLPLLIVTLLTMLAAAQFTSTLGTLLETGYQFSEWDVSVAFTVFGLVGAVVQGSLLRALVPRVGEQRLCLGGIVTLIVGLTWLSTTPGLAQLWVTFALISAGGALLLPTLTAMLSQAVGADRQGALLGLQQGAMAFARGVGSGTGGAVFALAGPLGTYGCAAACGVAAAIILGAVRPTRPSRKH